MSAADNPENNPLMAVGMYTVCAPTQATHPNIHQGHFFTSTLHHEPYAAISPSHTNFSGKSVVIIGASRGIGRAIALSFARAGASSITLCARSKLDSVAAEAAAAATAAGRPEPTVISVPLDVTSEASVSAAADEVGRRFGTVDVLVHNSGVLDSGKIGEADPAAWWRVWEVNVLGPFLAVRAFLPLLLKGAGAQVVITSSVGAWCTGPGLSAYQPSKLAVLRFADFVNAEYGGEGVVAFCVHPGNVLTDIVGGADSEFPLKHCEWWSWRVSLRCVLVGLAG